MLEKMPLIKEKMSQAILVLPLFLNMLEEVNCLILLLKQASFPRR